MTPEDEQTLLQTSHCCASSHPGRSVTVTGRWCGERAVRDPEAGTSATNLGVQWNGFCRRWGLLLASVLLVLAATGMVVTLPVYLEAINKMGSAYSGSLFVWLVVTAAVLLYCRCRYCFAFLRKSVGTGGVHRALRYGSWHGLACLSVVFALDRKRVLCHTQEPLMGLILLYVILLYCFYRGPLLSSLKLLCLCGVLAGLFLAMDFQLNDEYLCRGRIRTSPATDGEDWTMQEHALWTIVYAGALFLYALAWIKFEHLLFHLEKHRNTCGEVSTVSGHLLLNRTSSASQIPTAPVDARALVNSNKPVHVTQNGRAVPSFGEPQSGVTNRLAPQSTLHEDYSSQVSLEACSRRRSEAVHQLSVEDSNTSLCSSASSLSVVNLASAAAHNSGIFSRHKFDAVLLWFTLATLATVLALFWTDLFTALGKSGSATQFANLTLNGLLCHFGSRSDCGPTALHGWALVLYMLLFIGSIRELAVASSSVIFPLSVAALALPLSALFWSAFSEGGVYGIVWSPSVTGEMVFSAFGLPVMLVSLIIWIRLEVRDGTAHNSSSCASFQPSVSSPCSMSSDLPQEAASCSADVVVSSEVVCTESGGAIPKSSTHLARHDSVCDDDAANVPRTTDCNASGLSFHVQGNRVKCALPQLCERENHDFFKGTVPNCCQEWRSEAVDAANTRSNAEIGVFSPGDVIFSPEVGRLSPEVGIFGPEIGIFNPEVRVVNSEIRIFDADAAACNHEVETPAAEGDTKPLLPSTQGF